MNKISVIIPVYNTEAYLEECLGSICSQTLEDLEIICVDDGSTDTSPDILRAFAARDGRIRILDRQNSGVAAARNAAIDVATGEYIGFVDSDDWIDAAYFETMLGMIEKSGADVVTDTNYAMEYPDPAKRAVSNVPWSTPEGMMVPGARVQRQLAPVIFTSLYRKSFLDGNEIRFQDLIAGEDIHFTGVANLSAGEVFCFRGPLYHYRQRPGSLMSLKSKGFEYIKAFKMMRGQLISKGIPTDGVKLLFVESLFIEDKETFDQVRSYLLEIKDEFQRDLDIYTPLDRFLMGIAVNTPDYETFRSRYNPNISMSFIRARMAGKIGGR